jgi:hypothetical protein
MATSTRRRDALTERESMAMEMQLSSHAGSRVSQVQGACDCGAMARRLTSGMLADHHTPSGEPCLTRMEITAWRPDRDKSELDGCDDCGMYECICEGAVQ